MSFKLLGAGSTLDTVVSDMNQNILQLKNNETTEFFSDANGVRRVQLGQGANSFYGLKVSQPGIDVYTATDSQLSYNSGYNIFKIVTKLSGAFTLTSGASTTSTLVTITHSLGYVPFTLSNVNLSADTAGGQTGIFPVPFFSIGIGGGTTNVFIIRSYVKVRAVSTTTITYEVGTIGGPTTITGVITAYVLQETAT